MARREEGSNLTDIEIDYINQKRNVPFPLSPEEELLYGYSQDVTLKVLEVMRDKYESGLGNEAEFAQL